MLKVLPSSLLPRQALQMVLYTSGSISSKAGRARSSSRVISLPKASVMAASLFSSAVASGVRLGAARLPLLCMMTRSKSPLAAGMERRAAVLLAPADCPATVTASGSPPKAAMFSCTHSRDLTMSSMA